MKRVRVSGHVFLPLVLLMAGCAEKPQTELSEAQQALELAGGAEAGTYAADKYEETSLLLRDAEAEIAAQDARFFAVRNYDRAKEILGRAQSGASEAKTLAVTNKDVARKDAEQALNEARQALDMALTTLAGAPQGKGTAADLEALQADLTSAQSMLGEMEANLYQVGKYLDAVKGFKEVRQRAEMVTAEVQQAIAKR